MSYEKQEFKANTVLHASQLNAIDSQLSEVDGMMDNAALQITAMNEKINKQNLEKIDGAYVENGYLFLTSNGEVVVGNLGPFSGGGGSGSSSENEARLTVKNVSGWLSKTIAETQDCIVAIDWSSTEDGLSTGNGIIKIVNNGVTKATYDITQGSISVDLAKYLSAGSNSVRVTISDAYSNSRTINFSITVVSVSLTSTFDDSMVYDNDINFVCTPIGNINKTLHFFIDGKEISSFETTSSNRQLSFKIAKLQNGSHVLTVYFTAEVDGSTIKSNTLRYDLICSDEANETPIITSSEVPETATQFETINIDYYVYNPKSLTSDVTLIVNGETASTMTNVDRTKHTWSYRFDSDGSYTMIIKTGNAQKKFTITVSQADIDVKAEENDLSLYLTAYGRSNNETTKNEWNYGDIKSVMKNFNFVSDGWVNDEDGNTVLRLTGEARVEIPVKPFKDDFRTTGKTIEVEFATRDVLDYDSIVISCFSDNTGLEYSTQMIKMASEQSSISTQYKENEHVRISFVVEKRSENRLIYVYINGIASGIVQYPINDDFSQSNPVNITIGSSKCTTDIYTIRIYENDLTRYQILDNFIADTHNLDLMLERYDRNNIFDEYGQIVISKLPRYLPYLILTSAELPQYKGDKKVVGGSYINPQHPEKNFTFENAEIDVQGTSSAGYARKNYKIKFKGGFVIDGETVKKYQMTDDAIAVSTFTMKADVASSEGCNNVELVRLYNETCTYKTPPQKTNASVRQGIDGFPIVIFWNNGTETAFLGKYNFNNDKGTEDVYGFTEGDESWEVLNNTSDRVLFKSDDFTTDDWLNDFEARYPDGNTDCTNLKAMVSWVKSTENDLAKFKAEFTDWFELDAMTYYYIFTELFLMVDNRAKNMFPSKIGGSKWFILPYDFDTAIGINNEGTLAFSYNLEDIDQVEGADVFNGQNSVLWKNFRAVFGDNIKSMYAKLRTDRTFSYDSVEQRFEDHQSKWSEAIFNEDAYFKYIQPLIESGTSAYLSMLQGSKAEQRKWWLYNRFRYLDSKYNAGDAVGDIITLRGYAKGDITIVPYADIYATVKYGSYLVQQRATRGQKYTLVCPLDNVNDTEIYVYSCSQILEIGDISPLKVGYADFSLATKLSSLKIGDSSSAYSNTNLKELYLGNNTLLKTLDVRNCPNLTMAVDISNCSNIEDVYFDGTSITALSLPNGGNLKKLHLPNTITNLTLRNQTAMTEFVMPSYTNVSTLWIENVPSGLVNPITILEQIKDNSRVRVIGFSEDMGTASEIESLFDKFDTFRGLDEHGNNTDKPQISGSIHVNKITSNQLKELAARYPDVTITYDVITFKVEFYNGDVLVDTQYVEGGKSVYYGGITPAKTTDAYYTYTFSGWTTTKGGEVVEINALRNVTSDRKVYAVFSKTDVLYTIRFINNGSVLQAGTYKYGETPAYYGITPVSPDGFEFLGWNPEIGPVTKSMDYIATFLSTPMLKMGWEQCDALSTIYKERKIISVIFVPDSTPESYDAVSDVNATGTPVKAYLNGSDIIVTWDSSFGDKLQLQQLDYDTYRNAFSECFNYMFNSNVESTLNVTHIDITNLKGLYRCFYGCSAKTIIGFNNWNTSNIQRMDYMFAFSAIKNINMDALDTSKVQSMNHMFSYSAFDIIDISNMNLSKCTDVTYMFYGCTANEIVGIEQLNNAPITSYNYTFANLSYMVNLDLSVLDTSSITNMNSMCYGFGNKIYSDTELSIDMSGLDTSKVRNMTDIFGYCKNVRINGLSTLNTSSVTNMGGAFSYSNILNLSDINHWNFSNVEYMNSTFNGILNVSALDFSKMDTSKVVDMSYMLQSIKNQSINISGLDTSNVYDMNNMLSYGKHVNIIGLETLNTSNVGNMSNMFAQSSFDCALDLSALNTSGVTEMQGIFNACSTTSLNISGWNMSKVQNISNMFSSYFPTPLTIPATNGNGLANTTTRLYGKDESVYFDLSTLTNCIITIAS